MEGRPAAGREADPGKHCQTSASSLQGRALWSLLIATTGVGQHIWQLQLQTRRGKECSWSGEANVGELTGIVFKGEMSEAHYRGRWSRKGRSGAKVMEGEPESGTPCRAISRQS